MLPLNRFSSLWRVLGIVLILLFAVLQGLGFFQPLEKILRQYLPLRILPESPRVILVSLESGDQGYRAIDSAMALRALRLLTPRCVIIDGVIEPELGNIPLLPNIISRLRSSGTSLILPQFSAPSSRFQAVSLIRYSLYPERLSGWPQFEGKSLPGTGDAFLLNPLQAPPEEALLPPLPLLATTAEGSTIGSLWWWALPSEIRAIPLLLFGKILFLGNHTPLYLPPSGEVQLSAGAVIEMPLDNFLLHIEHKEQGTISPSFDSLWKNATVVLGTHAALAQAAVFASLLQETSYTHYSLRIQFLMTLAWMVIFLLAQKARALPNMPRWLFFLSIALLTAILLGIALLLLHQGVLFPFFPALLAILLSLIL
jgi:hypothetical protein